MNASTDTGRAGSNLPTNALLGAMMVLIAAVSGLIGAEIKGRQQAIVAAASPAGPRVLVLDATPWVRPIAADPTLSDRERIEQTRAISEALTLAIERELKEGAIILNGEAVHVAPPGAYVRP